MNLTAACAEGSKTSCKRRSRWVLTERVARYLRSSEYLLSVQPEVVTWLCLRSVGKQFSEVMSAGSTQAGSSIFCDFSHLCASAVLGNFSWPKAACVRAADVKCRDPWDF